MTLLAMYSVTTLCLLLLPHLASAYVGNLTISFFTNEATSCGSESQSNGVSLTTDGVPYAFTCFNLSDIFSQSNTTGFQLGRSNQPPLFYDDPSLSLGVNYTLGNLDSYNPSSNYTQILLEQMNLTSDQAGQGKESGRRVTVYSLLDCQELSSENGGDDPREDHPWYVQTCQTTSSGECHTASHNVQSFSIQENFAHYECQTWALFAAASRSSQQSIRNVVGLAAVVVLWVML